MKKDEFAFLIFDSEGSGKRLRGIKSFTLERKENEPDKLNISMEYSFDLPILRCPPDVERIYAEYDREEIFSGRIISYEVKTSANESVIEITAKGKLNDLIESEATPGVMKNPSAKGIEKLYLTGSGFSICSDAVSFGEMNVDAGTSVFDLIKAYADEFLGMNAYVRRNKIYFSPVSTNIGGDYFKLNNACEVSGKADSGQVCENLRVMDNKSGQYVSSIEGEGFGVKYRSDITAEEKRDLLIRRVYSTLEFKEMFEDVFPGDIAEFRKMRVLVDTVNVSLKNGKINFVVSGYSLRGDE